jgi:hypothetical protein
VHICIFTISPQPVNVHICSVFALNFGGVACLVHLPWPNLSQAPHPAHRRLKTVRSQKTGRRSSDVLTSLKSSSIYGLIAPFCVNLEVCVVAALRDI